MEWISIETKWREMTRRLQNRVPLASGKSTGAVKPAQGEPKSSAPPEPVVIGQMDERAPA